MGTEQTFEWDSKKAAWNKKKHKISFEEASTVFKDPLFFTIADEMHSIADEQRFVTIGQSNKGRTLVVVHSEKGDAIRIISARKATRRERKAYEKGE
jgi:uncharacterized DUF497 family protein